MMMKKVVLGGVGLFLLVVMVGCSGAIVPPLKSSKTEVLQSQPRVIMDVLDPSLNQYAPLWKEEIGRRFDNAVGILVHGGDFQKGIWIVGSDPTGQHVEAVQDVVKRVQAEYPGRTIVLLACNTGHLDLGIPGVYFARSEVWCIPDRAVENSLVNNIPVTEKIEYYDSDPEDAPQVDSPHITRWQLDPDAVGNIYEFVKD